MSSNRDVAEALKTLRPDGVNAAEYEAFLDSADALKAMRTKRSPAPAAAVAERVRRIVRRQRRRVPGLTAKVKERVISGPPATIRELASEVAPHLSRASAYSSVYSVLRQMGATKVGERDGAAVYGLPSDAPAEAVHFANGAGTA